MKHIIDKDSFQYLANKDELVKLAKSKSLLVFADGQTMRIIIFDVNDINCVFCFSTHRADDDIEKDATALESKFDVEFLCLLNPATLQELTDDVNIFIDIPIELVYSISI